MAGIASVLGIAKAPPNVGCLPSLGLDVGNEATQACLVAVKEF